MVKLDVEMLPMVPDAPPAVGPERALDPPPRPPVAEGDVVVVDGDVVVAEGDVAQPAARPTTAVSAAAAIHRFRLFDSMMALLFCLGYPESARRSCEVCVRGL